MSKRIKILLVDDIEQNLVALEALLADTDLEPLRANSGASALELLLKNEVALALVDVQMPGMDGFELAELMRGSTRTRHVPIIFLTATDRSQVRTFRGYEAGAVDFLYKPYDAHILHSKIDIFIELHQQKLQLAEQLATMQQLVRTNEMFVAVLGHDLRNPLSSIVTNAELLKRLSSDSRVAATASRIQDAGDRMGRMIEQLLDVARMRVGMLGMTRVPLNLTSLCEKIIAEFDASAISQGSKSRIELISLGDSDGQWDADRISQVVSNLLGNALQHSESGALVSVRIDGRSAHQVELDVHNAGVIPPDIVGEIFKPFRSGAAREGQGTAKRSGTGLGLGLYIVHELVRLHRGRVDLVSSTREGTTFKVILPRS
jgi:two-component system sensor histidine kinase/response regulator